MFISFKLSAKVSRGILFVAFSMKMSAFANSKQNVMTLAYQDLRPGKKKTISEKFELYQRGNQKLQIEEGQATQ